MVAWTRNLLPRLRSRGSIEGGGVAITAMTSLACVASAASQPRLH